MCKACGENYTFKYNRRITARFKMFIFPDDGKLIYDAYTQKKHGHV